MLNEKFTTCAKIEAETKVSTLLKKLDLLLIAENTDGIFSAKVGFHGN